MWPLGAPPWGWLPSTHTMLALTKFAVDMEGMETFSESSAGPLVGSIISQEKREEFGIIIDLL